MAAASGYAFLRFVQCSCGYVFFTKKKTRSIQIRAPSSKATFIYAPGCCRYMAPYMRSTFVSSVDKLPPAAWMMASAKNPSTSAISTMSGTLIPLASVLYTMRISAFLLLFSPSLKMDSLKLHISLILPSSGFVKIPAFLNSSSFSYFPTFLLHNASNAPHD